MKRIQCPDCELRFKGNARTAKKKKYGSRVKMTSKCPRCKSEVVWEKPSAEMPQPRYLGEGEWSDGR